MTISSPLENDENYILWTKNNKITWDDFQGQPDSKYEKELEKFRAKVTATIDHRLQWAYDNESPKKVQCKGIKVRCFFNKKLSWVKQSLFFEKEEYFLEVLHHEQGHFDLAEEYSRFIESKLLEQLIDEKFRVHGKTKEEKLINVDKTINKLDNKFYKPLEELWQLEDKKYDEETNHGAIKDIQIKWDDRFAKIT